VTALSTTVTEGATVYLGSMDVRTRYPAGLARVEIDNGSTGLARGAAAMCHKRADPQSINLELWPKIIHSQSRIDATNRGARRFLWTILEDGLPRELSKESYPTKTGSGGGRSQMDAGYGRGLEAH
jgi:hypothetical protein